MPVFMRRLKVKIANVYYYHGLFCATHPIQVIIFVCILVVLLCFPLAQLPIVTDVPLNHIVLSADEFRIFRNSTLLLPYETDKSLGYTLQVFLHLNLTSNRPSTECPVRSDLLMEVMEQSVHLVHLIQQFQNNASTVNPSGQTYSDICFQVEEQSLLRVESRADAPKNHAPTFTCLLLSPTVLWKHNLNILRQDQAHVYNRLKLSAVTKLRDLLFGMPWKLTGLSRYGPCNRKSGTTFAVTLVFREYDPEYIVALRNYLLDKLSPESIPQPPEGSNGTSTEKSHKDRVYLVWYQGRSYLTDYAPLIFIYVVLLLYVYFSVRKLEMVKSKCGLAVSACFTVVASLGMSMGLCVSIGLMVPTLNGSEVFPYLVVVIGFENVLILTKSVVSTPIDLPVKYRIAQGLSKESWPLTKAYFTELAALGLGFLTFHPTMQEFCLFAMVGLTADFFLQLFFFVTVLSIDIRRMEISDISIPFSGVSFVPITSNTLHQQVRTSSVKRLQCPTDTTAETSSYTVRQSPSTGSLPGHFILLRSIRPHACLLRFTGWIGLVWRRLRFPYRFRRGHKRTVSAAEAAAFLASDDTAEANVPRRLRVMRMWVKHRLCHGLIMVLLVAWILVLVTNALGILRLTSDKISSTKQPVATSSASAPSPHSSFKDQMNRASSKQMDASPDTSTMDHLETSAQIEKDASADGNVGSMDHPNIVSGLSITPFNSKTLWDSMFVWNNMAFHQWPLLAKHYNFTLAGYHLVLLDPIHIARSVDLPLQVSSTNGFRRKSRTASVGYSKAWQFKLGHQSLSNLLSLLKLLIKTAGVTNQSFTSSETDLRNSRSLGLLDELPQLKDQTEHQKKLSDQFKLITPGGWAAWTERLRLTVSMLGTGLLSCSFVLMATCFGMIVFQELQSKSSSQTQNREPVIRVLPLTIPLIEPDESFWTDNIPPCWTIACGRILNDTLPDGDTSQVDKNHGIVAVCLAQRASPIVRASSLSAATIRIWSTDTGQALEPINRFLRSSWNVRRSLKESTKGLSCRKSTVWAMIILPNGFLITGCSNGLIEIWNCQTGLLLSIVCLIPSESMSNSNDRKNNCNGEDKGESSPSHADCTSNDLHPGGITVISIVTNSSFAVGTSRGHVAWFDTATIPSSGFSTETELCSRFLKPSGCWHAHSRCVTRIMNIPLCLINRSNPDQFGTRSSIDQPNQIKTAQLFVTSSEDGHVSLLTSTMDKPLKTFSWDNTAIIGFNVSYATIAVSHASGALFVTRFHLLCQPIDSFTELSSYSDPPTWLVHPLNGTLTSQSQQHSASIGLQLFPHPDQCDTASTNNFENLPLSSFRLVTCTLDRSVTIWNLDPVQKVRMFRYNLPTAFLGTPCFPVDSRVVFGDQGYLRVVNPWTGKYERSVQLLPPATDLSHTSNSISSVVLSTRMQRWLEQLVPIGVAGLACTRFLPNPKVQYVVTTKDPNSIMPLPINESSETQKPIDTFDLLTTRTVMISLADMGQTLVIVPLSTVQNT